MKKNFILYSLLFACLIIVLDSCKTRNRYINRKFHDTNARFNGYFNAKESIKEAKLILKNGHQENWEEVIPIFYYPTEETAQSIYPQMDRAIEKCTKVIDRHSIQEKRKEYNKWIDDCWLLIGVANFYRRDFEKSEEMFKYVTRSFRKDPNKYHAALWNARGYIEIKEYTKAGAILEKLEEESANFPKKYMPTFLEVYSDFYVRQQDWPKAIEKLEAAIAHEDQKKKRNTRLTFILAQLYQEKGDSQKAIRLFAGVTKMNPTYEMDFHSRINQALAFDSRSNSESIREQLKKLLRDDKYIEFNDQIYYALAEVEFAERNYPDGIDLLLTSAEVSKGNDRQKGKSFLRLADYYFDQREYPSASQFFDSTVTYIPRDYPNYEIINAKKESLSDLVKNIEIIYHEDSLQSYIDMSEADRISALEKIVDQLDEEEEKRLEKEKEERNKQLAILNPEDQKEKKSGKSGTWYFYNASAKSIGFSEFKRVFGERRLEDNWRRKDKQSFDNFDPANPEESLEEETVSKKNVPTLEELSANLPLTAEAKNASDAKIKAAFYEMGNIYRENLKDLDNAIETFDELAGRYPDDPIACISYYQLYRLYKKKEEGNYQSFNSQGTSSYYREKILGDCPDSEFAALILNPDDVEENNEKREAIVEAYKEVYRQYRRKNYNDVMLACLDVINNDRSNELLPKYYFLRAMSIGGKKDKTNYIKALKEIVKEFPGTEEETEAKRLLGVVAKGGGFKEEDRSDNIEEDSEEDVADKKDDKKEEDKEQDSGKDDKKEEDKEEDLSSEDKTDNGDSPFKFNPDIDHFFMLILPNSGVDLNGIKRTLSDYHGNNFSDSNLKITTSFLDQNRQMVLIRKFSNKTKGMNYFNAFSFNTDVLKEINGKGYPFFIISSTNFATLFSKKDVDAYSAFFNENYF
ncbi:MAG: tetratricopeptide repeat protein [Flavobacteriales bacterium]|nr:tetratricopeptide repeat protein [Flavobacteriales bacterium]